MKSARVGVIVVVLLAVVMLVGCSGFPSPTPTHTPTAIITATPTVEPTPTPNIQATIEAAIRATQTAMPTSTFTPQPQPTPTSIPSATPTNTVPNLLTYGISASELYSAFEDNEIAAEKAYAGRELRVTGIVDEIGKDIFGNPYVSFKTNGFWDVQCYVSQEHSGELALLSKGQTVTVHGWFDQYSLHVKLRGCFIE